MRRFIKQEIHQLLLPVSIVVLSFVVMNTIIGLASLKSYVYYHKIEVWEQEEELFCFLFSAVATMPVCWLVYFKRKNHYIDYTVPRISKSRYLLTEWLIVALASAFIVFTISFVSFLAAEFAIPAVKAPDHHDESIMNHFSGYSFVKSPVLYSLKLSGWRAVLGFLLGSMGFVFSLFEKNIFVVLSGPFIFTLLDSFILANIRIPEYSLFVSFDPSSLVQGATSIFSFMIGVIILLFATGFLFIYYKKIKKEDIYQL